MIDFELGLEKKDKWSGEVTKNDKWHPPKGLFDTSAENIAKTIIKASDSEKQAIARVTFYENRAGKNLTDKDRARLELAKKKIREHYKPKESKKPSKESMPLNSSEW